MPWELPALLGEDFTRDGWRALDTISRLRETTQELASDRMKISALEASWYMRNQLLRDTDWASMTHSLEVRIPLVDWTLWRRVAPLLQSSTAPDKQAMARTPASPLPDAILNRAKSGFTVPTREWVAEGREGRQARRGLRGWARRVHEEFA